jgi:hypothetical protein
LAYGQATPIRILSTNGFLSQISIAILKTRIGRALHWLGEEGQYLLPPVFPIAGIPLLQTTGHTQILVNTLLLFNNQVTLGMRDNPVTATTLNIA